MSAVSAVPTRVRCLRQCRHVGIAYASRIPSVECRHCRHSQHESSACVGLVCAVLICADPQMSALSAIFLSVLSRQRPYSYIYKLLLIFIFLLTI